MNLDSINKIALHSQLDVKICGDATLKSTFENNIYSNMKNFALKGDGTDFFLYKFRVIDDSFRTCSLFLIYQSAYLSKFSLDYLPVELFIQYVTPITDMPKRQFSLAFANTIAADLFQKQLVDDTGKTLVNLKSLLLHETLLYPKDKDYLPVQ